MNPDIEKLKPYPFVRLAELKRGVVPPASLPHIALSIGEPRHDPPRFVMDEIERTMPGTIGSYPNSLGEPALREACAGWLERRYGLAHGLVDPQTMVLPATGTREALFAFAQAVVDRSRDALVLMPNPMYQIYEGGALLAGATPVYMNATAETGFVPDLDQVDRETWKRCQLIYVCSPGNPTGSVLSADYLEKLIELADRYDFVIAADECYADIYFGEPPTGLLEVCAKIGRDDFSRCVVFHSLSKRSNLPGLRSGFVAGDAAIMQRFLKYRSYHGCALQAFAQRASVLAWNDDAHAAENRALYGPKFDRALTVLRDITNAKRPDGAFYLWLDVPVDDEKFTHTLFATQNVTVLPGTYLARDTHDGNPGRNRVRISLVDGVDACEEAARRIAECIRTL